MTADNCTYVGGVSIGGYRGFGAVQRICPFSKINIFIGPNNSGKSNVLRFISCHLQQILKSPGKAPKECSLEQNLDEHRGDSSMPVIAGFGTSHWHKALQQLYDSHNDSRKDIEVLLHQPEVSHGTSLIWHEYTAAGFSAKFDKRNRGTDADSILDRKKTERDTSWNPSRLVNQMFPDMTGGTPSSRFTRLLEALLHIPRPFPNSVLIPTVRRVAPKLDESPVTWCGAGIIEKLAELQHPEHYQQEKQKLFHDIQSLLRNVIGNQEARIDIPNSRKTIHVAMEDKVLPLEALGTGLHELIILATACTSLDNTLICIEEPEIHLHPLLQRRLIRYLAEKTHNQYFIATHSAALMDTDFASVFRVSHDGKETSVCLASQPGEKWLVCHDLGYKASDLMQANCVIWVEGPSDRIYLNHWIGAIAPELNEGTHYSIMFYGGRLLCHLTANDEEVGDFISLNQLNRNPAILIDRDTSSGGE